MLGDHLGLAQAKRERLIAEDVTRAVIHGNPDRVMEQAKLLDESRLVAQKRGFTTYTGKHQGVPVLISSTGMGTGSAAIAIEELRELGIERMIRVGTCGAYLKDAGPGDFIIPTKALIDGPSLRYLSPNYLRCLPPSDLPDWAPMSEGFVFIEGFSKVNEVMTRVLSEELERNGHQFLHRYFTGPVHDKDVLHAWRTEYSLKPFELEKLKDQVRKLAIATDMETGVLYTISHMRKMESGSILTIVDFSADEEKVRAQDEALGIAYRTSLRALISLGKA